MRHAISYAGTLSLVFAFVSGFAFPEVPFSPFVTPFIQHFLGIVNDNNTSVAPELRKRQEINIGDACPDDYNPCVGLGAAGLCCSSDAQCALDNAGRVACCPIGAVCTGIIDVVAPTDDIQSVTSFVLASTTDGGVVINVGGTSTQGFVVATTEVSAGERHMPPALPILRGANRVSNAAIRHSSAVAALTTVTFAALTALRWRRRALGTGRSL